MKNRVITISREFGSGGRTIGKLVAQKLGIPCYDYEIISKIAEESGFSKEYIENEAEKTSYFRPYGMMSNQDYMWTIQIETILELAKKGSCVIVGRCADYVLKDRADCLNVFIHSSFEKRAERIVKEYGETEVPTEKRLKDKDKKRASYYQYYTDKKWGDYRNYHLALDSGELGIEKCVEIITDLY